MSTKIVQKENAQEIPAEIIAQDIETIATAMRRVTDSRLTFEAVVLLVHNASGVSKSAVREVLRAAMTLDRAYLKPAKTLKE